MKITPAKLDRLLLHGRVKNPDWGLDESYSKYLPLPPNPLPPDTEKRAPRPKKQAMELPKMEAQAS